jgi:hypothetical protein
MATASKTQHGTGRHDHRKGGKARTTRVELEQSQPMTKMQDQLQQEESTGQHRQQHGNSPCSQRILMESTLLGETGTQPQGTMQEDSNTTGKECSHNGEEEEGTTTGTCHQIQNND